MLVPIYFHEVNRCLHERLIGNSPFSVGWFDKFHNSSGEELYMLSSGYAVLSSEGNVQWFHICVPENKVWQ